MNHRTLPYDGFAGEIFARTPAMQFGQFHPNDKSRLEATLEGKIFWLSRVREKILKKIRLQCAVHLILPPRCSVTMTGGC